MNINKTKRLFLHALHKMLWPVYLRQFRRAVKEERQPSERLLKALVYHWGNSGFSADHMYLALLIREAMNRKGLSILECGSGLSTFLLGLIADARGHLLFALEHDPEWCWNIQNRLDFAGIDAARVVFSPLRNFGEFEWYDAKPLEEINDQLFDFVVCDGPPGQTRGGRVGLPYVVKESLKPGCLIFADDTHRKSEALILQRWSSDFGLRIDENRSGPHFKTLILPDP